MLDILLIPAALLVILALRAVRQGAHRLHGYLMTAAFTLVGLRLLLHPVDLTRFHLTLWAAELALAGTTLLLGKLALGWREGNSRHPAIPRTHRGFGTATLVGLAATVLVWLLRHHR